MITRPSKNQRLERRKRSGGRSVKRKTGVIVREEKETRDPGLFNSDACHFPDPEGPYIGGTHELRQHEVSFPQNLKYFCPAFPPRRGYLTVNVGGADYKMFSIGPTKTFELVYPKAEEDGWIYSCITQYIGPDLVMISDYCYTNYIHLI